MIAVSVEGIEWIASRSGVGDGGIVWRARMPHHDLLTFENTLLDGYWRIEEHSTRHPRVVAEGTGERDAAAAKLRASAVYAALTHDLKQTT